MQMCHSLRCKQIDMSTANDLKSIFPNNAGGTCTCNRVKTGWKTEGTRCDYDHWMRSVFHSSKRLFSILQAHAGQIVSLLQVNRTSETLSEPESTNIFESDIILDKTTGSISSKLLNQSTLEAKQNETQSEDLSDDDRSHGKLQKRTRRSKCTRVGKGAHRYTVQRTIEITTEENSDLTRIKRLGGM